MNGVIYSYASGDLLEDRNTYFYSAFEGADFIDAWLKQRRRALVSFTERATTKSESPEQPPVVVLLEALKRGVASVDEPSLATLDKLVQRFEVTKRLHDDYMTNWRAVDKRAYRGKDRYLLFAERLEEAYTKTGELPYLNCLLKVMDTITATITDGSRDVLDRMRHLVDQEYHHIAQLQARLGST